MYLKRVEDKKEYTGNSGMLTRDVYNESGALIARKGSSFQHKLEKMPLYIKDKEAIRTASTLIDEKRDELKALNIGPATIELFENIYDTFRQTLVEDSLSPKNLSNIEAAISDICQSSGVPPLKIHKCISAIRDRDNYTLHHSMSVMILMYQAILDIQKYSTWNENLKDYFKSVDFSKESIRLYLIGSLMHDYGKAFIPRKVLQKNGPLTSAEWELIKQHPKKGIWELKLIDIKDPKVIRLVGNHHGNYCVFKEGQRPLEVVINILDIYDACRSDRPYKPIMDYKKTKKALDVYRRGVGWRKDVYDFVMNTTIKASETFIQISNQDES